MAYGIADYSLPGIPQVSTGIFRCARCQALIRDILPEQIRDHCGATGYANVNNEDKFRRMRERFFRFLYHTVPKLPVKKPLRCLDFGCSYGHFMELLRDEGWQATGIEFLPALRASCAKKGLAVFESLDALPETAKSPPFDLIALIDSLYYVTDPNRLMNSLRDLLCDDGLLLIRMTNRHWGVWLFRHILRRTHYPYRLLGDATVAYNRKTLDWLLANNGFTVVKLRYWDRGKRQSWRRHLLNTVGAFVSRITCGAISVSLGLTVVAQKRTPAGGRFPGESAP